jgi:hypothetical protein
MTWQDLGRSRNLIQMFLKSKNYLGIPLKALARRAKPPKQRSSMLH